jgi:hypothetical protein
MTIEPFRAVALDGVPHGFLGRRGGVSTGLVEGLNTGWGAEDDRPSAAGRGSRHASPDPFA